MLTSWRAKFKLIFVWPIGDRTQRRNKVIVFLFFFCFFSETCFFSVVLKSVVTLFQSLCEEPIHYLLLCLGETAVHMVCAPCVCFGVGLCRFEAAAAL